MIIFRRTSLSWKILLGLVPILLVALAITVVLQNRFQEIEMMDQAQESAHTYADIIRESLVSMMVNSQQIDTTFLTRVGSIQQFDSLRVIVNPLKLRTELLSDDQVARISSAKRWGPDPTDTVQLSVLNKGQPVYLRSGNSFRAVIPFNATNVCQKCHAVPLHYTLGAADLHTSLERFSKATAGNWKRSILIFVVFTVVAIAIAALMFQRFISTPIDRLVHATREIQNGNLAAPLPQASGRTAPESHDELQFLAQQFEVMRRSLAEKIERLDQMNSELSKRNTDVEQALDRLRKAQEDLVRSERLAVAGTMAAQLSHEINNPIHNTQSLLESSLGRLERNPETRELIGLALDEVRRMAELTKQLLNVYRGTVVELPMEPVNIQDLLQEITRTHESSLERQGIRLSVDTDRCRDLVRGSRDKLTQVFLNLILNARDAMPKGGIIRLRASSNGEFCSVDVADTGTGILPAHRERVFDAFFTTKKQVSGVGLGLSVTYGIVQQHRGTISFESVLGKGTTFTVQIPVIDFDHEHESRV